MSKLGPEKICLRFWDILGGQVQNDLKTLGNRFLDRDLNFFEKMSKLDPEKICLRFWGILGCQVQNDLKTLGNRFLSRDLNFLKNDDKNWSH